MNDDSLLLLLLLIKLCLLYNYNTKKFSFPIMKRHLIKKPYLRTTICNTRRYILVKLNYNEIKIREREKDILV